MNINANDIDEELLKELFPEIYDDFIFTNELTGQQVYVNNKKKRYQKKRQNFDEAVKRLGLNDD